MVWVGPSRRRIESSCGRIFPVPRPVLLYVYSLGRFLALLSSALRSFASIYTYICGQIVDCMSRPSSHSSSGTFEEAYLIFLWLDFCRSNTCIIEAVFSWSITYVVVIGSLLLFLDPYIYIRAYFWLSGPTFQPYFEWELWGAVSNLPVVVFFPFQDLYYCVCTLLVDSLHFLRRWYSPLPISIHTPAGRFWLSEPTFQPYFE